MNDSSSSSKRAMATPTTTLLLFVSALVLPDMATSLVVPRVTTIPQVSYSTASSSSSTPTSSRLFATKITDWDKQVSEPPATGGRRYGPNWSVLDSSTLAPEETSQHAGTLAWGIEKNKAYVHPELRSDLPVGKWLNERPNLGVCMSGGGMRAATCALGWYRGLNKLGLFPKIRFLGANSGATWTSLPLIARQVLEKKENNVDLDYESMVGVYQDDLSEINLQDTTTQMGEIGNVLEASNILKFERDPSERPSFNDWCTAIDENYVTPVLEKVRGNGDNWMQDFWLDMSNAYLWNTDATKDILNQKHSMPFPIFVATGYDKNNIDQFFPIENTFLYSGIPVDPRALSRSNKFGGGFVQGVGLNSKGPGELDSEGLDPVPVDNDNHYVKTMQLPSPVVKISELTGASSNFGASGDAMVKPNLETNDWLVNILNFFLGLTDSTFRKSDLTGYIEAGKYQYWSPSTGGESRSLNFVDGGMFDNLGVLSLLRRGCSTIICCDAADGDVIADYDERNSKFYDLAALFGKFEPFVNPLIAKRGYYKQVNPRSKVFDEEEFDILIGDFQTLKQQGKPLVVRKTLTARANPSAGIFEDRDVDMIFVLNGHVQEFEDGLSDEAKAASNIAENFPYVNTMECDYSAETVNKLSQLNSYSIVKGLENVGFKIEQVEDSSAPVPETVN